MTSSGKYIGQAGLRKAYLEGRRDMIQDAMDDLSNLNDIPKWFNWAKQALQTIIGQLYDYEGGKQP